MKVGFLITARLKSTRLPMKIMKDLNGRNVIQRLIDRIKEIEGIDKIVLCTSTNPQDDQLEEVSRAEGIECFRGHEDDVLQRLLDASNRHGLDYFMGITADNPLITIRHSNDISRLIRENKYDFIKLDGLPLGAATYGLRVGALETVCRVKEVIDTEIWGYLINRPQMFSIKTSQVDDKLRRPGLRFTLDYPEDYEFIHNIYTNVKLDKVLDLYDVMDYLDAHPEVLSINAKCVQRDLDQEVKNRIDAYYNENLGDIVRLRQDIYRRRGEPTGN